MRKTIGAWLAVVWVCAGQAGAAEYALAVSEDTAPYSFVPTLARYNAATLYAFVAEDENQVQHIFETYLRFPDLSGVIPEGERVLSAKLLFYYAFDFTGFGDTSDDPGDVYCHEITGAWNQTTLTWNNRPPVDPTAADAVLSITGFGLKQCDVTAVVDAWARGLSDDNGLALISPTARVIGMHSSEASVLPVFKPTLVIDTVTPVPSLSPLSLALLVGSVAGAGVLAVRKRR